MKIAITGASGFIGRRLIDALGRQGCTIRVLSRTTQPQLSAGIEVVKGDLTSPECPVDQFVRDCETIFHCAGEIRDVAAMRLLHVDGTQRLLQAVLKEAARRGCKIHWVQLSSVGAYGPPQGNASAERVVMEDTLMYPVGEYEVTKVLSDELVIQSSASGLMSYSIVRPSIVIGAGMPNKSLRALGTMVRKGLFFYIGRSGAVAPYVHADDVAAVLQLCGTDPRGKGKIFNVSNDCLLEEMIGGMAAALGVRRPWLRLPEAFVRAFARAANGVVPIPLTPERINALVARTRYPCDKLEKELGFIPRIPIPGIIGEVLTT
jgi:nucleoside-diphosphate-sugar epimerase